MNIHSAFQSTFLRAAELRGPLTLTIKQVTFESLGDVRKAVVRFQENAQGLVLNRTNARILAHLLGPETDHWTGKRITLFVAPVEFRGRQVPGIRVKTAAPQPQAGPADEPPPQDYDAQGYDQYDEDAA